MYLQLELRISDLMDNTYKQVAMNVCHIVPVGNQYPEINSLHPVHQLHMVHQKRSAETCSIHLPIPKRIFFCYQKSKTIASSWSFLYPTLCKGDHFYLLDWLGIKNGI
jgi:hypothetical protein